MTRNVYAELKDISTEGVYLIRDNGIIDYGARWAFGYAVPLRELRTSDFKQSTLFVVDDEDFAFANHIDALRDATNVARSVNQSRVYSLRDREWVKV